VGACTPEEGCSIQSKPFYRPGTVREALRLLQDGKNRARLWRGAGKKLGGRGDRSIRFLIDITHRGLSYIRRKGKAYFIGARPHTMGDHREFAPLSARWPAASWRGAGGLPAVRCRSANMGHAGRQTWQTGLAGGGYRYAALLGAGPRWCWRRAGRRQDSLDQFYPARERRERYSSKLPSGAAARRALVFQKTADARKRHLSGECGGRLQLDSKGRANGCASRWRVAPAHRAIHAEKFLAGRKVEESTWPVCDEAAREVRPITDVPRVGGVSPRDVRVLVRRGLEECAAGTGCSL